MNDLPSLFPLTGGTHLKPSVARRHHRSSIAEESPTRTRLSDDILVHLSPLTAVDALSTNGPLRRCLDHATAADQAFAMRTALASKQLRLWLDELAVWAWPAGGGPAGFETPEPHQRRRESVASEEGTRGVKFQDKYVGYLLESELVAYEERIEEIQLEMEDLNVEEIKSHVLHNHIMPLSRPGTPQSDSNRSLGGTSSSGFSSSSYTRMDDLTAVLTAIVMQALPNLSKLTRLMNVWGMRLTVLRGIPSLLTAITDAEVALQSGWNAISLPTRTGPRRKSSGTAPDVAQEDEGQDLDPSPLKRSDYDVMKLVLQKKVASPGRKLDYMLDSLEGLDDTLPEEWLDRMETVERAYAEWVAACERMLREAEWAKAAREREQEREKARREEVERIERERLAAEEAAAAREEEMRKERERLKAEAEAQAAKEEQAKREAAEEAAHLAAEEASRLAAEEAARQAAAEQASRLAAEEAARQAAAEEATRLAAEEAARQAAAEEAARQAAAEEAIRLAAEEAARQAAAEEASRLAAEEAARQAAAEEAARQAAAEEAARQAAAEEAARLAAEEAARQAAIEEAARQAAIEEAARQAAIEEAARQAAIEEAARQAAIEEATRQAAIEEAARQAAIEEAARQAAIEEAARQAAIEEAARQAAIEEATRLAAEKAAKEEAEMKEAAERAAQEKAKKLAAEMAAQAEAATKAGVEAAVEEATRREAAETPAREAADREVREEAKMKASERAAQEEAKTTTTTRDASRGVTQEELLEESPITVTRVDEPRESPVNSSFAGVSKEAAPDSIPETAPASTKVYEPSSKAEFTSTTALSTTSKVAVEPFANKATDVASPEHVPVRVSEDVSPPETETAMSTDARDVPGEVSTEAVMANALQSGAPESEDKMSPPMRKDTKAVAPEGLTLPMRSTMDIPSSSSAQPHEPATLRSFPIEDGPGMAVTLPVPLVEDFQSQTVTEIHEPLAISHVRASPALVTADLPVAHSTKSAPIPQPTSDEASKAEDFQDDISHKTIAPSPFEKEQSTEQQPLDTGITLEDTETVISTANGHAFNFGKPVVSVEDTAGTTEIAPMTPLDFDEQSLPPLNSRRGSDASNTSTIIHGPAGRFMSESSDMPDIPASPELPRLRDTDDRYREETPDFPSSPPVLKGKRRTNSVTFSDQPTVDTLEPIVPDSPTNTSFLDDDVEETPSEVGSPSKRPVSNHTDAQLQQQISEILESIPANFKLSAEPSPVVLNPPGLDLPRLKKAASKDPIRRSASSLSSRASTPSFTLAPAYAKNPRPRHARTNQEIKVYHLSRSTGEAPIKLFIRLVGEHGERVMVRVGGGWADLGEYLKWYATHHGRRSTGNGEAAKVEIRDLPHIQTTRNANNPGSSPPARPASALDFSPVTPLNVRKTRKSFGPNDEPSTSAAPGPMTAKGQPPKTPAVNTSAGPAGNGESNNTPSSGTSTRSRSSSRLSWDEEDSSLGLAGPTAKKIEMSEESRAWVESVKEKVRLASGERKISGTDGFGDMGKVGGTKRLFRKG